jgi:hypothetical protein
VVSQQRLTGAQLLRALTAAGVHVNIAAYATDDSPSLSVLGAKVFAQTISTGLSSPLFKRSSTTQGLLVSPWGDAVTPTGGVAGAPLANQVIADTGPLAAGDYEFTIIMAVMDTNAVGKGMLLQHRTFDNSGNVQPLGGCASPGNQFVVFPRYTMALNQRMRIIVQVAGAAGSTYTAGILTRLAG